MQLGVSAVVCYLHACRHQNEAKCRKYLARTIWLMTYDDEKVCVRLILFLALLASFPVVGVVVCQSQSDLALNSHLRAAYPRQWTSTALVSHRFTGSLGKFCLFVLPCYW